MKVKMITLAAGPAGVLLAGQEYNLPEAEAKAFIDGGYAAPVQEKPAPAPEEAAKAPEVVAAEKVLADAQEALKKAGNKQEKAAAGKAVAEAKAAMKALLEKPAQE